MLVVKKLLAKAKAKAKAPLAMRMITTPISELIYPSFLPSTELNTPKNCMQILKITPEEGKIYSLTFLSSSKQIRITVVNKTRIYGVLVIQTCCQQHHEG